MARCVSCAIGFAGLLFAGTLWGAGNPAKAPVKPVDLVYSTDLPQKDGGPLQLTLACPKSDKPLPCFVFIHGGAWSQGNRTHCPFRRELTAAGWAYASIDYRLNRKGSFPMPEQLEDCRAAIRFLQKNAAEYGLDPKRICVAGGSAGGHLAALVAVTAAPDSGIVAAVDMFGPTDFHTLGVAMLAAERQNQVKNPKMKAISQALGIADPDALFAHFDDLAPVSRLEKLPAGTKLPRFLVLHSKGDPVVPVRQSEAFGAALKKFGAEVTLKVYEGDKHRVPPSAAKDILTFLK